MISKNNLLLTDIMEYVHCMLNDTDAFKSIYML